MRLHKKLNLRSFVSLTIFLSLMVILVTSILMFSQHHDASTAIVHTSVGFGMLIIALWHLKNNFTPLKQYFKWRTGHKSVINIALPLSVSLCLLLVLLSTFQFSPLLAVYEWGNRLRAGDTAREVDKISYDKVDKTLDSHTGAELTIDLRKGPYFAWPQYAIWVETLDGEFIQPIYVTSSLAKNNFINKVTNKDNSIRFNSHVFFSKKFDPKTLFNFEEDVATKDQRIRPESLPVFLHKLGKKSADGFFVPTDGNLIADSYTGATINNNFLLKSRMKQPIEGRVKVRLEVNHSFDFNEYYSSDRFPDDPIYSGSGYSAQPSIIYEAIVNFNEEQEYYPMKIIGHGHHSGQNGLVYQDMGNFTTALELIDRVIIEVKQDNVTNLQRNP
ncbi:MAG: DUF4405 domain-containing protein [Colwellia sp.]|nr:DUF4405 domain-containing protein [Colwellia sp.]